MPRVTRDARSCGQPPTLQHHANLGMGCVGELVEERGVCDVVRRPEGGQVAREGVRVTGEVEYRLCLPRRLEHLRLDHALARWVEQHGGWACVRGGGRR